MAADNNVINFQERKEKKRVEAIAKTQEKINENVFLIIDSMMKRVFSLHGEYGRAQGLVAKVKVADEMFRLLKKIAGEASGIGYTFVMDFNSTKGYRMVPLAEGR